VGVRGDGVGRDVDETVAALDSRTVGQTGTTGNFDVTLNEVIVPFTAPNEYQTPDPGNQYIAVDVTMVNNDDEQHPVSSLLSFELTDSEGRKYTESLIIDGTSDIGGQVPPKSQRRGTTVYEVPAGITGLELRVRGDAFSSGGTVFKL
jgi:hypothetical protein